MSNKQPLSFGKCTHFIVHYFKYSHHVFKPGTVLGSGIFSTYKIYVVFCNTGNKCEVAITSLLGVDFV